MALFNRWWNGIGKGWQRVNYLLLAGYVVFIVGVAVSLYYEYQRLYSSYLVHLHRGRWWLETPQDVWDHWIDAYLGDHFLFAIIPLISYLVVVMIYRWLKEGFLSTKIEK